MTDALPPAGDLAAAIVASDLDGSLVSADVVAATGDLDLTDAAAIQLQVLMRHAAAGDGPAGWKVGMTSGDNRDKMGPGVRPFGFVRRSRLFRSGARIALAGIPDPGIEPEIGVRIARPLGGDVTRDDVLAAIEGVVPCFELGQRRMPADLPKGVSVAADLSQWGVVAGDAVPWPGAIDDLVVTLDRDGERVATAGPGFSIDDPIDSLRTLCAALAPFGLGLLPGQVVITGAFAKARVGAPGVWHAQFGGLGSVDVEFTGAP